MPVQPLPGAANLGDEARQVASGPPMLQNPIDFRTFVAAATGFEPMDWQARLACGTDAIAARPETLQNGFACRSRLIDIPTGCGKTAGAVFAWLWNRVILGSEGWPRRLVYCLPMRALVDQIVEKDILPWLLRLNLAATQNNTPERSKVDALLGTLNDRVARQVRVPIRNGVHETPIEGFLFNRLSASAIANLLWLAEYSPIVLMGGEELDECRRQWDLYPEKPAIVIGTQDMLLSRALNRGYGMSRYRWPMHFGLLNTDCLWVLDEVQLMSTGFTTSLQLQAWRTRLALRQRKDSNHSRKSQPTVLPTHSWWMSATSAEHWLKKPVAVENDAVALWQKRVTLDRQNEAKDLLRIPKVLNRCSLTMPHPTDTENGKGWEKYARALAEHLATPINRRGKKKAADTEEGEDLLSLVICNTVERATAVYTALRDLKKDGSGDRLFKDEHLLLLHSRFRGNERANWRQTLEAFEKGEGRYSGRRIIVATQVIEAGVDISASVLYTELCPLASLIQRLGRCARRTGESGRAFWIDFTAFETNSEEFSDEQVKCARPYDPDEIASARKALLSASQSIDVSLGQVLKSLLGRDDLADCPEVRTAFPFDPRLIPQRRDLYNLFDTTPDLSGADIDISPFIRDGQDLDVLVFWRDDNSGLGPSELWKSGPRAGCPFKKLLPARDELCPVPAWQFREFFTKTQSDHVWVRDWRKGWVKLTDADRIYPGQVFLLHKDAGGYDPQIGWNGSPDSKPQPCPPREAITSQSGQPEETVAFGDSSLEDEDNAVASGWQSVQEHSVLVACELESILKDAAISCALAEAGLKSPLMYAPPWHDFGKSHEKFVAKLTRDGRARWIPPEVTDCIAKAPNDAWKSLFQDSEDAAEPDHRFVRRPGFRHELASALGLLELLRLACPDHPAIATPDELKTLLGSTAENTASLDSVAAATAVAQIAYLDRLSFNLLLFLVACHHGKIRLGLRSTENDYDPDQLDPVPAGVASQVRRCQGVQDRDALPPCRLPSSEAPADLKRSVVTPALSLSLDAMELFSSRYGASWTERMRELLEVLGPFNLGYLEALIRAADQRASKDSRGI